MKEHPLFPATLADQFDVSSINDQLDDEAVLQNLSVRIAEMMQTNLDYLLSLMYRLDILEENLQKALHPSNPEAPHIALARLVIERQKQRLASRAEYRTEQKTDKWDWDF